MAKLIWLVCVMWAGLWGVPAQASEAEVHGFAMVMADTASSRMSPHVRLILSGELADRLRFRLVGTPVGPLHPVSYAELIWKVPLKGMDSITVGRTFPVFGNSWYFWRVDQVPTIYYSSIYGPNAAEDTGVTIAGHNQRFHWYVGGFAGQPLFGNDLGPAAYFRGEYRIKQGLLVGVSQRASAVAATGADVVWRRERLELAGEMVSSQGVTQALGRGQYQVSRRVGLALQHEWLVVGNRWTLVSTTQIRRGVELKVGYQLGEQQSGHVIGQLVLRW